jgi:transposase-like protein
MAKKMRDGAKERLWREVVKRFARSGLSVRAFCRQENLAESAFYFWRQELPRRDQETQTRAKAPRRAPWQPEFLPVRVTDPVVRQASITLELAGGRVLRLPDAISAARLAEIVAALEARAER